MVAVPVPVHGPKQRALLALQRGQPVSADLLWGNGQAANPAKALQAQIGQLRRTTNNATPYTIDALSRDPENFTPGLRQIPA